MALEPAKLSDFQLGRALGSGTTAQVFEAVDRRTGRLVAVKMMDRTGSGVSSMRERFAREALLLSGVYSKHVGAIVGFGFDKGKPFLVLERLNGETLDARLRRDGPAPLEVGLRWMEQLLIGVRDCHHAKVIHRDVKPSNIFLHRVSGDQDLVKLIDFGVARLREITADGNGLTAANHLLGSMGYMAPEQFENASKVGYEADLYAVGVVIYRTLAGRLPFVSRSAEAVLRMKQEQAPPPISSVVAHVQSPALDAFIERAMQQDPEQRFRSARDMLDHWRGVVASFGAADAPSSAPRDHDADADDRTIQSPPSSSLSPSPSPSSGGLAPGRRVSFPSQTLTTVVTPTVTEKGPAADPGSTDRERPLEASRKGRT